MDNKKLSRIFIAVIVLMALNGLVEQMGVIKLTIARINGYGLNATMETYDGDATLTVLTEEGARLEVRLIGVTIPYEYIAKDYFNTIVKTDMEIYLLFERDAYDINAKVPTYVYLQPKDVGHIKRSLNGLLIKDGIAEVFIRDPYNEHIEVFESLMIESQNNGLGMWEK